MEYVDLTIGNKAGGGGGGGGGGRSGQERREGKNKEPDTLAITKTGLDILDYVMT